MGESGNAKNLRTGKHEAALYSQGCMLSKPDQRFASEAQERGEKADGGERRERQQHKQRNTKRGRDDGMAGGEGGGLVSSAHENDCTITSCAGRKRGRPDFQLFGKELFTEKRCGKPFPMNGLCLPYGDEIDFREKFQDVFSAARR